MIAAVSIVSTVILHKRKRHDTSETVGIFFLHHSMKNAQKISKSRLDARPKRYDPIPIKHRKGEKAMKENADGMGRRIGEFRELLEEAASNPYCWKRT